MAILRTLTCGLALVGYALSVRAQAPEAARLIRLNVVATDSRGQPVTDLTADDLKITDQGKAQRIVLFRKNAGAAPAEHEYTNRPAAVPHTTAILFDFLNSVNRAERIDAGRRIGQSLQQLESAESVYMYLLTLDGKLYPIHPIPGPGETNDPHWTKQAVSLVDKAVKSENKTRPAGINDEEIVKRSYVGLETMAKQLAAFPGRRDIVWVTNGMPNVWNPKTTCSGDWIDCALYVPHLSVTLEAAGALVNPISYTTLQPDTSRMLEEMAGLTGGRAYFGEDMAPLVKQLADDSTASYTIAYDPGKDNWDSKFHKIRAATERKGIKLQVKQRYYALPDTRPAPARQQAALVTAYQSPSDVSDIGLRVKVATAGNVAKFELRLDPTDLQLTEQGEGHLTLLFSARTAAGPQGDPGLFNFDLHLTKEQRAAAMKDGVLIGRDYPINEQTQKVRVMVLDQATNSVGSVTVPVR